MDGQMGIELSDFAIEYKTKTTIKSQALENYVADVSLGMNPTWKGRQSWPMNTNSKYGPNLLTGLLIRKGLPST